jgi:hypothetical protein
VNGDGDCLSDGDVELAVRYFLQSFTASSDPLLTFTQQDAWVVSVRDETNVGAEVLVAIAASVSGSTLTLSTPKAADALLQQVDSATLVGFEATHFSGGERFEDRFPN